MLKLNSITLSRGNLELCHSLTINIQTNETWAVLGHNGAGKTTLLHSIARLHKVTAGNIFLQNKNINAYSQRALAQRVGLLLQDTTMEFPSTVYDTILLGRYPQQNRWGTLASTDHALAQNILNQFELTDLKNRCMTKLSGGESRRVALAMLALQQPDIYLLDEPTNHLDIRHQIQSLDYFTGLGKTLIMTLHDVNLAKRYCSHVLLLGTERCIHGPVNDVLTAENLSVLFQQNFKLVGDEGVFISV